MITIKSSRLPTVEGLPIETVSLLLGHATSKTTESYYCLKRQDVAIREAQALWSAPRPQSTKNAKIDFSEIGYLDREAKVRASGFATSPNQMVKKKSQKSKIRLKHFPTLFLF